MCYPPVEKPFKWKRKKTETGEMNWIHISAASQLPGKSARQIRKRPGEKKEQSNEIKLKQFGTHTQYTINNSSRMCVRESAAFIVMYVCRCAHILSLLYILRTSRCETFRIEAKRKLQKWKESERKMCCKIYFIVYWFAIEFKYSNVWAAKRNTKGEMAHFSMRYLCSHTFRYR